MILLWVSLTLYFYILAKLKIFAAGSLCSDELPLCRKGLSHACILGTGKWTELLGSILHPESNTESHCADSPRAPRYTKRQGSSRCVRSGTRGTRHGSNGLFLLDLSSVCLFFSTTVCGSSYSCVAGMLFLVHLLCTKVLACSTMEHMNISAVR